MTMPETVGDIQEPPPAFRGGYHVVGSAQSHNMSSTLPDTAAAESSNNNSADAYETSAAGQNATASGGVTTVLSSAAAAMLNAVGGRSLAMSVLPGQASGGDGAAAVEVPQPASDVSRRRARSMLVSMTSGHEAAAAVDSQVGEEAQRSAVDIPRYSHQTMPAMPPSAASAGHGRVDAVAALNPPFACEPVADDNASIGSKSAHTSNGSVSSLPDYATALSQRPTNASQESLTQRNTANLSAAATAATSISSLRKRNLDFHALFPTIPVNEILVDDYNCALQKEILVQGRLYISERNVCFYANIFGWVTNLIIPFSDFMAVEKRNTAYVIPNAIHMVSSQGRFFFTSFLFRDSAYASMIDAWKRCRAAQEAVQLLADNQATNTFVPLLDTAKAAPAAVAILPRLIESYQGTFLDGYQENNSSQDNLGQSGSSGSGASPSTPSEKEKGNGTGELAQQRVKTMQPQRQRGVIRSGELDVGTDSARDAISDGAYTDTELDSSNGNSTPFSRWRMRVVNVRSRSAMKSVSQTSLTLPDGQRNDGCVDDEVASTNRQHHTDVSDSGKRTAIDLTRSPRRRRRRSVAHTPRGPNGTTPSDAEEDESGTESGHEEATTAPDTANAAHVPLPPLDHDISCQCSEDGTHGKQQLAVDAIIEAPLPLVADVICGSDTAYMRRFHTDVQKNRDVAYGEWQKNEEGQDFRSLSYEIPIRNPLGPKSAKAYITEKVLHKDTLNYVTVLNTVSTPDVPQGSNFVSITRVCLMRCAQPNRTRLLVTCTMEWAKSTWLKGPIEKGVQEGNQGFYRALAEDMKRCLATPQAALNDKATRRPEHAKKPTRRRPAAPQSSAERHKLASGSGSAAAASDERRRPGTANGIASHLDSALSWLSPIRLLGILVVGLCIAVNVWCWYQLTGYRTADEQALLSPMISEDAANKILHDVPQEMEQLLEQLAHMRQARDKGTGQADDHISRLDKLRAQLLVSYERFRQLDMRVLELTRRIFEADREIRALMHTVDRERGELLEQVGDAIQALSAAPSPPTPQVVAVADEQSDNVK